MRLPTEPPDLHYPEMEAEAKAVILKGRQTYKNPSGGEYFETNFDKLAEILVDYIDRPNLLSEIFYQLYNATNKDIGVSVGVRFFVLLSDLQIQKLAKNYVGANLLYHFASRFLNSKLENAIILERIIKTSLKSLYAKIQPHLVLSEIFLNKPFVGDIVPNYSGISDRFSQDHDGIHIRSPKEGGNVITVESLQGIVVRQYKQEVPSEVDGIPLTLYAVNVLLKNGMVVVYKDLLTVAPKLKTLALGREYWVRGRVPKPTSNLMVSTGDLIGTVRPWYKNDFENVKNDVGLHLTFLRSLNALSLFTTLIQKKVTRPLDLLVFPCGSESPVRCLK